METSRFDTVTRFDASPFDTTSSNEITQEFRSVQVAFARAFSLRERLFILSLSPIL